MFKKIFSLVLVLTFTMSLVALAGCGENASGTSDIISYSEKQYPALSNHSVFIWADANGNLRPNDALTVAELTSSLNALAAGEGTFSAHIAETAAVNHDQLKAVLGHIFDANNLSAVFSESGQSAVKRGYFAVGMCKLLGRGGKEKVAYSSLNLPKDISFGEENLSYLLEASIEHTVSTDGKVWDEVELSTGLNPGFQHIDGWLYYVKQDGCLLKNDSLGRLTFGADGRYTTGDKELDATVAGVLKGIIDANPGATRWELLRKAFIYSYEEFSYGNRYAEDGNHNVYDLGYTGWEVKDAKNMFALKEGNCYCFAAVFWALARGLGYEARAVAGTCLKDYQPHGWVIIEMDGEDFIFDPEWQWAYINEHKKFDKDMFKISLDAATWWNYRWDKSQ